ADVCDSLLRLGRVCGRTERAAALVSDIKSEIRRVSLKVKGRGVPSVMLCVSRELSENSITTFYAAGQNNFYNEIISVAGGRNSVKEKRIGYPQISIEGMMKINPDVIIDLVGDKAFYHSKDSIDLDTVFNEKYMKDQWIRSARARAVSEGRIYIMQGTMFLRPGPRVGLVLRSFASAIHPEVSW
ncbi:MAG: ABC transporter substrate-binding protein, partial [Synergistaceae bacterium]